MALLDHRVPDTGPGLHPTKPDLGYAYLMTGVAVGSVVVGGVFGSIFCPDQVTGLLHDHFPIGAATGWIWGTIGLAIFLPVAMRGIRARVTDRVPWTTMGIGMSVLWLGSMLVTVFAPVWTFGTDPDQFPFTAGIGAALAVILTAVLCSVVKAGYFQPSESETRTATTTPAGGPESAAATQLRQLAQLRDSGVISEADFEAKKHELLGESSGPSSRAEARRGYRQWN